MAEPNEGKKSVGADRDPKRSLDKNKGTRKKAKNAKELEAQGLANDKAKFERLKKEGKEPSPSIYNGLLKGGAIKISEVPEEILPVLCGSKYGAVKKVVKDGKSKFELA